MGNDVSDTIRSISSIIKTLSNAYEVIQVEDANKETDEGIVEKGVSEVALERTKSVAPRNRIDPVLVIFKIQTTLRQLKRSINDVKRLQIDVQAELDEQLASLLVMVMVKPAQDAPKTSHMSLIGDELEDLLKKLLDLKRMFQVLPGRGKKKKASPSDQNNSKRRKHHPLLPKKLKKRGESDADGGDLENDGKGIECLPGIHANEEDLKRLAVFRQVREKFKGLVSNELKICLLSFAVFPANHEVNRTMLMYWWIGEGVLPDKGKPEDAVKEVLAEFTKLNLIEPIENNRKVEPTSYRMLLFVHSSVLLISKEMGLFDKDQKPAMKQSDLNKVCLVEGSSSLPEARPYRMALAVAYDYIADIETVFNVSERFPDFIFNWFSRMKELKVLYLGTWERTEREIEVDSYGLMNDLSSMTKLRFLSFQGISTIRSISGFACKLPRLIILDLRGCYNLEQLPDDIHNLKNLVYLDLTGCNALEGIPMRLSWLDNLEVLKGFVVTSEREIACKLSHLKRLPKLRRLCVTVDRTNFGLEDLLKAIDGFRSLEKLKVLWTTVTSLSKKQPKRLIGPTSNLSLPPTLRKLYLLRFPDRKLPNWLHPQNLCYLENLHLGSSRQLKVFSDSLPEMPSECNVKVLRLTCLRSLKVDWLELKELYFPQLRFLEVYECPGISFSPCDRDGIWRAEEDDSQTLL